MPDENPKTGLRFAWELNLGHVLMIITLAGSALGLYGATITDREATKSKLVMQEDRLSRLERLSEKLTENQSTMIRLSEQVSWLMQERKAK